MKNNIAIMLFILIGSHSYAQLNYQFLLRDDKGKEIINVSVKADVIITDSSNAILYKTTQNIKTNQFGLSQISLNDSIIGKLKPYSDYCQNYCGKDEYCECDAIKININCYTLNTKPLQSICIQYIKSSMQGFFGTGSILHLQGCR